MNHVKIDSIDDLLGDRQSYSDERIKCDWLILAIGTNNFWLVLASHQINDYRLVSSNMCHPTLRCYYFVGSSFALNWLNVWFFADSVQILVKAINQERKELLRIVLSISWKNRINGSNCGFQTVRRESVILITPHSFDKFGISFCQFSFGTKWIFLIDFVLEMLINKIVGKRESMRKTLQTTVHEASVSQIC